MEEPRNLRFGYQLRPADLDTCITEAQAAEAAGFDVVTIPDHIGDTMASPLITLAAIARETTTIRLGTFVLNNEMRNPVQLAWEAATLDRLSNGRFELGIGAGHTPQEFDATGLAYDHARIRKQRLAEAVDIITRLFGGETVDHHGEHYDIAAASIEAPLQARLPIMVAGNGDALLTHAAQTADIVGLNGLGKRFPDGHRHTAKFGEDWLTHQVATIGQASAERTRPPEVNALVQRVTVTDDREGAAVEAEAEMSGVTAAEILTTPYLAIGTHDEIAAHFRAMADTWGITYFVARNLDDMKRIMPLARARGEAPQNGE